MSEENEDHLPDKNTYPNKGDDDCSESATSSAEALDLPVSQGTGEKGNKGSIVGRTSSEAHAKAVTSSGVLNEIESKPEKMLEVDEVAQTRGQRSTRKKLRRQKRSKFKRRKEKTKVRDEMENGNHHLMKLYQRWDEFVGLLWRFFLTGSLSGVSGYNLANIAYGISGIWEQAIAFAAFFILGALCFECWLSGFSETTQKRVIGGLGVVFVGALTTGAVLFCTTFASAGKSADVFELLVPKDMTWMSLAMIVAEISALAIMHHRLHSVWSGICRVRTTAKYNALVEEIEKLTAEIEETDAALEENLVEIARYDEREGRLLALLGEPASNASLYASK